MPDFEPGRWLWGLSAAGRDSGPRPADDDPARRYWKPPLSAIRVSGHSNSVEEARQMIESEVARQKAVPVNDA